MWRLSMSCNCSEISKYVVFRRGWSHILKKWQWTTFPAIIRKDFYRFCPLDFPIVHVGQVGCTKNQKGGNVQSTFIDVKIKVGPRSAHVGHSELSPERLEPYEFGYCHFSWVNFVHMQRSNLITLSLIPLLYILFRIKCHKAFTLAWLYITYPCGHN